MTTPPRPDQEIAPPPAVLAPGGASGIFRGRLVIVNGQTPPAGGIYIYDSTGSLVGYWVSVPGTDPLDGSSINPGLVVQNGTSAVESVNIQEGSITLAKTSGLLVSPEIVITDATQSAPLGNMTIDSILGASMESWNYVGSGGGLPAFGTGWSNVGGGFANMAYQLKPDNTVMIVGTVHHTNTASQTIFTLPANWRPASSQQFTCLDANAASGFEVNAAGAVEMLSAPSAAANTVISVRLSLDV